MVGIILLVILLSNELIYNSLNLKFNTQNELFIFAMLFGIVGAYILGHISISIWAFSLERLPVIKNYTKFIYPIVTIFIILLIFILFIGYLIGESISITYLLGILSISIIGGLTYVGFKK